MMVVGGCLTRGWFESADSTDCLFWFVPLYGDSPKFSPCYLASGFTLGFVALEQPFCFINVFSDAIAEVCPGETEASAISPFHNYRTIPEDGPCTFEISVQLFGIVTTTGTRHPCRDRLQVLLLAGRLLSP